MNKIFGKSDAVIPVSESVLAQEVAHDFNHQTEQEHAFRFFVNLNATAFLVVAFAASGMSIADLMHIVVWVYLMLSLVLMVNIVSPITRWIDQSDWLKDTRLALSYLVYDCALAFILLANANADLVAPTEVAVAFVVMAGFISLAVSPRSIFEFVLGKAILFSVVAFVLIEDTEQNALMLFPVLLAFVLMSVPAYWIYLMRLRMTYQKVEQRHLMGRLQNETGLRERLMVYIGHDLRQPINALGMLLHAMPGSDQNLVEAKECVRSSKRLIGDIVQVADYQKELSRVDSEFSIQSLMDAIKLEYNFIAKQANCQLRFVDTRFTMLNDPALVGRILRNFVANAITHASASTILIGVRRRKASLDLLVLDNGIGVSDNESEAIFKEFVRAEKSALNPGLGLGLSIAKHYAEVCDAEIIFESNLGRGTMFGLRVPFKTAKLD